MTSKLIVDVLELLQSPGTRKPLVFAEGVEGLSNQLVRVEPAEPLGFDLVAESMDEGVLFEGDVSGRFHVVCRRCLEETESDFDIHVAEIFRPRSDVWEEGYVVEGQIVDLHAMVRDNVVLAMPEFPLCRADCLGLCSSCGANLNQRPCTCTSDVTSDRWSALKALLED